MSERPILFSGPMVRAILSGAKTQTRRVVRWPVLGPSDGRKRRAYTESDAAEINAKPQLCPFGAPGDTLWGRETWQTETTPADRDVSRVRYAADGPVRCEGDRWTWRPSIHMPRWASRLTLRVTSVRVERLHAITEEDARAEGVLTLDPRTGATTARERFADLWREINGAGSWDVDPWVWRLEFYRRDDGGPT